MPAQDWLDDPDLPQRLSAWMRPEDPASALILAHRAITFLRRNRSHLQAAVGVVEAPFEMAELAAEAMRARDAFDSLRRMSDLYSEGIFPPADKGAAMRLLGEGEYSRLHGEWARHLLGVVNRTIAEAMGPEDADTPAAASPAGLVACSPKPHRSD